MPATQQGGKQQQFGRVPLRWGGSGSTRCASRAAERRLGPSGDDPLRKQESHAAVDAASVLRGQPLGALQGASTQNEDEISL